MSTTFERTVERLLNTQYELDNARRDFQNAEANHKLYVNRYNEANGKFQKALATFVRVRNTLTAREQPFTCSIIESFLAEYDKGVVHVFENKEFVNAADIV